MDGQEPTTTEDDIQKVRKDVEALRKVLRDPVEAARITYELLLTLRDKGSV